MSFRFRKTVRLFPGLRLNIGKKGVSLSAGIKGAAVTVGKNGVWGNAGVPGTGISYRKKLVSAPGRRQSQSQQFQQQSSAVQSSSKLLSVRLSLDQRGEVNAATASGELLNSSEMQQLWANHEAELQQWLATEMEKINGGMADLIEIYMDIVPPGSNEPEYEAQPFALPELKTPSALILADEPVQPVFKLPLWKKCIPGMVAKARAQFDHAVVEWRGAQAQWQNECQQSTRRHHEQIALHQQQLQLWEAQKNQHDANQQKISQEFRSRLQRDEALIAEVLSAELELLDWPRETLIDFEVDAKLGVIYLDVDFPEIEDMPTQTAMLGANQRRLLIKDKSDRQLRMEYATHIHSVILRLAGVVYALLPGMQRLVLSGYSQRLNKATGHIVDEYLLSVEIEKTAFSQLNFAQLDQVDPIAALERYRLVRDMTTTGLFKPIQPLGPNSKSR